MKKISVLLDDLDKVNEFVDLVEKFDYHCEIGANSYFIDAKSIIGIFSLDITKPLTMVIHTDGCDDLCDAIADFIV